MSNGIRALCIHIVTVEVEDHPPARSQRGPLHKPPLLLRSRIRKLQPKPMQSGPRHNLNVIYASRLSERPERRDDYRQRKPCAPSTLLLTKALSLSRPHPGNRQPARTRRTNLHRQTFKARNLARSDRAPRVDRFVPERGPKYALSHASKWQALKSLRSIRQGDKRPNSRREVAATQLDRASQGHPRQRGPSDSSPAASIRTGAFPF